MLPIKKYLLLIGLLAALPLSARDQPVALAEYARLPGIEAMRLSASGALLATVATIADQRVLVVGEVGGAIRHKVAVGDTKLRNIHWAGDDFVIVQLSSTQNMGIAYGGRYELFNIVVLNLKTGELDVPLANSRKVFNAVFDVHLPVKADGRWYQCVDTLPTKKSMHSGEKWFESFQLDLSCIDLASGKRRVVAKGRRDLSGWLVGNGLEVIAYETYDDIKAEWSLYSYKDKTLLVRSSDPFGSNRILGHGRTPGRLIYSLTDASGSDHYFEISTEAGSPPVELYSGDEVHSFFFHAASGLLRGVSIEGDKPAYEFVGDRDHARVGGAIKAFPDNYTRLISGSSDFARMIVVTDGGTDSGTWWLVDIGEGSADPLGYSYPMIRSAAVGPSQMISYKASDGMTIPAVLTLPPQGEARGLPLVIMPHGGPQSRDYPGFDWQAQAFASRGYAVLQPNFRGSGHYGLAFRDAGFGQWGRKMQTDLSDGIGALAASGLIDPARVCIVGASYGGYAALAGVTLQQGIYRCAVSFAGVSDMSSFVHHIRADRQHDLYRYIEAYLGSDAKGFDIDDISPIAHAKKANAPVLLIHGEDDTRVEPSHSRRMASRLKSAKKPFDYIELEGEDHFLSLNKTRIQMLEATVNFVMQHNPPSADIPRSE